MVTYHQQESSKPFIDKISLTFDVAPEDQSQTKSSLLSRLQDAGVRQVFAKGYELSVNVSLAYGVNLFIQVDNNMPDRPYGRVEFNPGKVIESGTLSVLEGELTCLSHDTYEEWMSGHNVSRVDVAIDLKHVNINDVLITAPNFVRSGMWCAKGGRIETLYLGSDKSPSRLKLYDKRAELMKHGHKAIGHELTRIEYTLRKTGLTPAGLLEMPNPFADVTLYSLSACIKLGELMGDAEWWGLFFDSCAYRGLHAALLTMPPHKRNKIKEVLKVGKLKCWQPPETWKSWPDTISPLLNV